MWRHLGLIPEHYFPISHFQDLVEIFFFGKTCVKVVILQSANMSEDFSLFYLFPSPSFPSPLFHYFYCCLPWFNTNRQKQTESKTDRKQNRQKAKQTQRKIQRSRKRKTKTHTHTHTHIHTHIETNLQKVNLQTENL